MRPEHDPPGGLLRLPPAALSLPPSLRLTLLFADDALAAFAKPSGLLVHRGWGDDPVTAADLVREALGEGAAPVHRLDRATSGVLLCARRPEIAALLQRDLESGAVEKTYLALVRGSPPDAGTIDHPIPRREGGPRVPAVTRFRALHRVSPEATAHLPPDVRRSTLVEARPLSGRLHQVRRHLKHIHHPVIGDANYGKGALNRLFAEVIGLRRLALHALSLRLRHPVTGEQLVFNTEPPEDLAAPLAALGVPVSAWAPDA